VIAAAVGFVQTGSGSGCLDFNLGQCVGDLSSLPTWAQALISPAATGAGSAVDSMAGSAWDSICQSFADAFTSVLQWFGAVFASMPDPDLDSIHGVYAISLTLGMIVAMFLLIMQAGSVVWTRSGAPLAQALTGLPKAALAALFTLAVSTQIMAASDALTSWIVHASGTSMTALTGRLTTMLALSSSSGPPIPAVLVLLFGLIGIVVVLVLWFELVLRNAVFCILVATAPISAAGQIGSATQEWWRKLVKAGVQLAMVKPVIALVFVLGFDMAGNSTGITGLISGMAVLFMAVFAWPAIGRFFTFTSVSMGGAMGAGAAVGSVANRSASGGPGIDPASFGQFSERQAMSANAARGGSTLASSGGSAGASGTAAGAGSGAAAGAAGGGGAAAGATAASAAGGPAGIVVAAAIQTLHKTINAVASRMEQQAGHAGLDGANPTAYPAGYPSYGPIRLPGSASSSPGSSSPQSGATSSAATSGSAGTAASLGKV
jgi:hypothetical protein